MSEGVRERLDHADQVQGKSVFRVPSRTFDSAVFPTFCTNPMIAGENGVALGVTGEEEGFVLAVPLGGKATGL